MDHPAAAKTAKWTAWFIGASATTGGSVLLSTEISKLLHEIDLNITESEISMHITNFTAEFEKMLNESFTEFERKPNPGIFGLYFKPFSRVKRENVIDFQFDFERVSPLTNNVEMSSEKPSEGKDTRDITANAISDQS